MKKLSTCPSKLFIELTSVCNKKCSICGRRKLEKIHPKKCNWGHMNFSLVEKIAEQIPRNIMVKLYNDGEPLCYPHLNKVLKRFTHTIRCFNTNGKLLLQKSDEIIDNLESLTISVIENDLEGDEQFRIVKEFLKIKGNRKPIVVFRLLGDVDLSIKTIKNTKKYIDFKISERKNRWDNLAKQYKCNIATRTLHNPMGSFDYTKKVTIAEEGICLDALNTLVINKDGEVSLCVRFDYNKELVVGDINKQSLYNIWNGKRRQDLIRLHILGKRKDIPFCNKCDYWGCPTP